MAGLSCKIDLHMHSTVSDGTDTPKQLLRNVIAAGIGVFSVTDHDAVKTGQIIRGILREGDPRFITGVEFSCKDENGKYHILGYGFDPENGSILNVVEHGHDIRMKKVRTRLDLIGSEYGFVFPEKEKKKLLSLDNPGKPHIANLMVKYGYAETKEKAMNECLNLMHIKSEYIRPEEAIGGILESGGIPVLAHPFYGSGDELILGSDMEERICRLKEYGLQGIEAFYSGFTSKLKKDAVALAEKYGLYVTAGSDYHGKNKMVGLADTGLDGIERYPDGLVGFLNRFDIQVR